MILSRGSPVAFLIVALLPIGATHAQSTSCAISLGMNGTRLFRCPGGVEITVERGATFELTDRNGDGSPDSLSLRDKAVLVDVDAAQHRGGFQVVTPQAIAAVRGTQWAVDVTPRASSVLVTRGRVRVNRLVGLSVSLGPGEGVDVELGPGPLTVRTWPPQRAAALLTRLGQ